MKRSAADVYRRLVTAEEQPSFLRMFADDPHGYEKRQYEVLVGDCEAVSCWPNAEMMHALDGSGRSWPAADVLCKPKHDDEEEF
jgi:hypothetical protein